MAEHTKLEQLEKEKAADDRFEQFVGILIASVTILAAITAFYQTHASTEASRANRRAQAYSLSATTQRLSGASGNREELRVQRLAAPHELEHMLERKKRRILVIAAGQPPVILQRILYYEDPHFAGAFDA